MTISTNQESFVAGNTEYAPGDVYSLKTMDQNEMGRQRLPTEADALKAEDANETARKYGGCPTCKPKKPPPKGKPHAVWTKSCQVGPFVGGSTTDLSTGNQYITGGIALPPSLGCYTGVGVADPGPGATAEDV